MACPRKQPPYLSWEALEEGRARNSVLRFADSVSRLISPLRDEFPTCISVARMTYVDEDLEPFFTPAMVVVVVVVVVARGTSSPLGL
ncbi:uncharacterized protein B0I36DRAFT_338873 [Microdochium trichocladiopsis]|uniref:Uncharacterized protein n=1 Tax=Microdochium trichocladiopsis TaxID=1682393 RepID=A0A9P9BJD8_9PEZI|nr:uncharacterized protein B0I36DRAFT_338873 [Microdochium trichocladiopsis]KAH7014536.1 hypothetical protein B0I36DRAFT_338873 [Microdochium trichocladiopsis]